MPCEWPKKSLGDLFRIHREGITPLGSPSEPFEHYSLPAFDETGKPAIELGSEIESNKTLLSRPAVLVSKLNPRKPRVMLVAGKAGLRRCASTEWIPYVPVTENEDLGFYTWFFRSDAFSRRLEKVATGSTNSHVRVSPSETLRWKIPSPPLPEQRRIAEILDTLDEAIRKTEQAIAKLQQMKQGLLHDLLTKGLDENGELRDPERHPEQFKDSPIGRIPRGWEAKRVGALLSGIEQGWSPDCEEEPAQEGSWGVLKTTAVTWSGYDDSANKALPTHLNSRPEYEVRPNDVLVTRAGPNSRVGVVALVRETQRRLMLSDKLYRLLPRADDVRPAYLALALSSAGLQRHLSTLKTGLADSQTNISQAIVRSLFMPLPDLAEQDRIWVANSILTLQVEAESARLAKLRNVKRGIMNDLLTGRVRVNVPEEAAI